MTRFTYLTTEDNNMALSETEKLELVTMERVQAALKLVIYRNETGDIRNGLSLDDIAELESALTLVS